MRYKDTRYKDMEWGNGARRHGWQVTATAKRFNGQTVILSEACAEHREPKDLLPV